MVPPESGKSWASQAQEIRQQQEEQEQERRHQKIEQRLQIAEKAGYAIGGASITAITGYYLWQRRRRHQETQSRANQAPQTELTGSNDDPTNPA